MYKKGQSFTDPETGEKGTIQTANGGTVWVAVYDSGKVEELSAVEQPKYEQSIEPEVIMPPPSPYERVGRGALDIWQGTRQLLPEDFGGYTPEQEKQVATEEDFYNKAYSDWYSSRDEGGKLTPDIDWWRTGGQAGGTAPLALLPGGQATAAGRFGMGALAGLLGGGSVYEQDMEQKLINAGMSGAGGGLFSVAAPAVAQGTGKLVSMGIEGGKRFKDLVTNIPNLRINVSQKVDDVLSSAGIKLSDIGEAAKQKLIDEAKESLRTVGKLDEQALLRKARAERFGFADGAAPTTGQLTRDPILMGEEYNISKGADEAGKMLRDRLFNQYGKAGEYLRGVAKDVFGEGVEEVTPYSALNSMTDDVQKTSKMLQEEVSRAYKAVPGKIKLSTSSLDERTKDILETYDTILPPYIGIRVKKIISGEIPFSIDEYIKLDQKITDLTPDTTAGQNAVRELKEAMFEVFNDSGNDLVGYAGQLYKIAKAKARQRFNALGDPNKLLGRIESGKIDDQQILNKIRTGSSVDDVGALFKFGSDQTKKQVRALILNDLIEKSVKDGEFNQAVFNKRLGEMAKEKVEIIFGNKAKDLKEFGAVTKDLFSQPSRSSANYSGSGITIGNMFRKLYSGLIDFSPELRVAGSLLKGGGPNQSAANRSIAEISLQGMLPKKPPLIQTPNIVGEGTIRALSASGVPFGLLSTEAY